jgi:hypothetical protein
MGIDIRVPLGAMFTMLGSLLAAFGLFGDKAIYTQKTLGINVNLDWGVVLLLFGIAMLFLGLRSRLSGRDSADSGAEAQTRGH